VQTNQVENRLRSPYIICAINLELTMLDQLKKRLRDEEGQDLVEYALLLVFIALAAIAVLPTLGSAVGNVFSQSASTLGGS
jgi:Flp pilus assembly pilin Flp